MSFGACGGDHLGSQRGVKLVSYRFIRGIATRMSTVYQCRVSVRQNGHFCDCLGEDK